MPPPGFSEPSPTASRSVVDVTWNMNWPISSSVSRYSWSDVTCSAGGGVDGSAGTRAKNASRVRPSVRQAQRVPSSEMARYGPCGDSGRNPALDR